MKSVLLVLLVTAISALAGVPVKEARKEMEPAGTVLIDFADSRSDSWLAVNDGVMGGLSQSTLKSTGRGTAVFSGAVSLENNGGFASVRTRLDDVDLSAHAGLAVRVLGDGNQYRLRLRTDKRFDGVAYQAHFQTAGGDWQVIEIPFASFSPTYRGRAVPDAPPLNTASIHQVAFMIADKQEGRFRLEIAWVKAYGTRAGR